jgi:rhodanese-related sulfurtransferase
MTRRILATGAGLLALAAVALAPAAARGDDPPQISVDDVEKLLAQPGVTIYDVNPPDLWEKHHLPGSIFIGQKKLATLLPADKGTKLVFYCAGPK